MTGKWNLDVERQFKGSEASNAISPREWKSPMPFEDPHQFSLPCSQVNVGKVDCGKPVLHEPLPNGSDYDYNIAGSANMLP